jgi:hypothetical protein
MQGGELFDSFVEIMKKPFFFRLNFFGLAHILTGKMEGK